MSQTFRIVSADAGTTYDFLANTTLNIQPDSLAFVPPDGGRPAITARLWAASSAATKANTLQTVLDTAMLHAADSANQAFYIELLEDSAALSTVRAVIFGYRLTRASNTPDPIHTGKRGEYDLYIEHGPWEANGTATTLSTTGQRLDGRTWLLTGSSAKDGTRPNTIESLTVSITAGTTYSDLWVGIKPASAESDLSNFRPRLFAADNNSLSADSVLSGTGTTAFVATNFSSSTAMAERATFQFDDWGDAAGAGAPTWANMRGRYYLLCVYSYNNSTPLAQVKIEIQASSSAGASNHGAIQTHPIYLPNNGTTLRVANLGYINLDFPKQSLAAVGIKPQLNYFAKLVSGTPTTHSLRMHRFIWLPAEYAVRLHTYEIWGATSGATKVRVDTVRRPDGDYWAGMVIFDVSTLYENAQTQLLSDDGLYWPARYGGAVVMLADSAANGYSHTLTGDPSLVYRPTFHLHHV